MVSMDVQVAEYRYQIRRKQTELDHVHKVLDKKKQTGMLSSVSEGSLLAQEQKILADIQDIERRIRAIENAELRRSNTNV